MSKMSRFCTGKMVMLLDSSGNNPIKAERIGTTSIGLENLTEGKYTIQTSLDSETPIEKVEKNYTDRAQ
jgi:hypothetical protein